MKKEILDKIEISQGDITQLSVDAIVNAANSSLLGGGGVDGAIHRAAGPELLKECRTVGGCPTGEARITRGYNLPARHVIHTVGPVYSGQPQDKTLLSGCYQNSLKLAAENHLRSIAFPAISCGVYGYPIEQACEIALNTTCDFLKTDQTINQVIFMLFSTGDLKVYLNYIRSLEK
ncbi:MAG: O-acetyl-ADP-ribose deacetylase [Desulfobacterales bacterium]|jgi:O-acetyl-ADP-ribose deacetylase (regulator of RNase III)